ncbi:MAG: hypothetical protein VZQ79_06150 [Ruminococcus sp.]|nr:hypothetical protein [uncultured Ruminococcus sp.]MEE3474904.1 hypothetical protein [Ruminococcus sp.]
MKPSENKKHETAAESINRTSSRNTAAFPGEKEKRINLNIPYSTASDAPKATDQRNAADCWAKLSSIST